MTGRPLILSACLDMNAQEFFNKQREKHFPDERNYLDAHLTLFHKLPPDQRNTIQNKLQKVAGQTSVMNAQAANIMFMGFGSAYKIECPPLYDIRRELAQQWNTWLTPQDKQGFKPHITFQNKVDADQAKELYANKCEDFTPFDFQITGLSLWYYDNGPWEHMADYPFR